MKILVILSVPFFLNGCGAFSATNLRCGTDGDSSYVEIISAPQSVSANVRAMSDLCAFAYEGDNDG